VPTQGGDWRFEGLAASSCPGLGPVWDIKRFTGMEPLLDGKARALRPLLCPSFYSVRVTKKRLSHLPAAMIVLTGSSRGVTHHFDLREVQSTIDVI
jgi:hypothetical protein